eukprot:117662-Chlamydomonas_euryale.AAC.1
MAPRRLSGDAGLPAAVPRELKPTLAPAADAVDSNPVADMSVERGSSAASWRAAAAPRASHRTSSASSAGSRSVRSAGRCGDGER